MTRVLLTAAIVWIAAGGAAAQQRPLTTEDPETIGAGFTYVFNAFTVP
jgi:hypothetical protein